MPSFCDGPSSPLFEPLRFRGNTAHKNLSTATVSRELLAAVPFAPCGTCVAWGIPFRVGRLAVAGKTPVRLGLEPVKAPWLVFMHTSDVMATDWNEDGFISPMRGAGRLGEAAADYVFEYADGTEARHTVRRRFEIGMVTRGWGENAFECVAHHKPYTLRPLTEQPVQRHPWDESLVLGWGQTQTRAAVPDLMPWVNWIWAWENPSPNKAICAVRIEPRAGTVLISGITAGRTGTLPYRWETRRKAVLRLPKGQILNPQTDSHGALRDIRLDLGQIITAQPRTLYPNEQWSQSYNNQCPELSEREVLIEYAAHPEARFHFPGGKTIAASKLESGPSGALHPVAPATHTVTLKVVEKGSTQPLPVKLHLHGEAGEYLAPVDRHRVPNPAWYEDYSVDFLNQNIHCCSYIDGETTLRLPLGRVYLEISKGFEIAPVRKVFEITPGKRHITIELERVLPWRARGWVTADTHVHFLSPHTALLEGQAEGVNVVNLLASQWGELFTNIGDFDGRTTLGAKEDGGDGEHLVRVGTENRQHVLGHLSLLGYAGRIITPLTTGGPDESAIGDPVDILLSEWARQCRKQGGLAILPHFPNPRCEGASCIVQGDIDAIEMASWGNLYGGIDPYSLSDWYRYLNCGYFVPAVGGTDKMTANTAVGAIRTYARLPQGMPLDYTAWMDAIRGGHTFVSYGPLMEFSVDGRAPGQRIAMKRNGGAVDVVWEAASVTMPMSRVELIVNGEIRESKAVDPRRAAGCWRVKLERSSWLALLVRGHYPDKPEVIAAHSSPVVVQVEGREFYAAADALSILEQIEGALAFLDTAATRAESAARKRMRNVLVAAHKKIHLRMHAAGHDHTHTAATDHKEHH